MGPGMLDGTLIELLAAIERGETTPSTIADEVVDRVDANRDLNAIVHFEADALRQQARELQTQNADERAGVPVLLKANIALQGAPLSCSSRILEGYRSPYDAHVVSLLKRRGALLVSASNMDEFAMGSSGENSAHGATKNPWSHAHVPGGSSSGAAAAVAAGIVPVALGSDTGGSIRQPAAFCGVVGLKPTWGAVSRRGLVAYGSSLDQIGPITRSVEDAAWAFSAIQGHDPLDSTSAPRPGSDVLTGLNGGVKGLRVGVPREYFGEGLSTEVNDAVQGVLSALREAGAEIVDVSLPHTPYAAAAYYIVATAEASSNLARFDGVRYGYRSKNVTSLDDLYARSRAEGFGPEVRRRIMLGTFVLSAGYYDAYYRRAQQVRQLVARDFRDAFASCDVMIAPTTPAPAFRIGENTDDPMQMYLADVYTVSANLAGIPALSVPAGLSREGLPIGVQFMANLFEEATLLRAARAWEQARGPFARPEVK